ncbi:MAG: hypothetical protein SPF56_10115 [Bacteroidaceae bacterium]|nr:hypothetical protein [Prevotellaceae bacterium]MDY5632823.1 hypothetical protein [Bacteroidaceae bacterium]
MKLKAYTRIASLGLCFAMPALWMSCTDTWDEHYGRQSATAWAKSNLLAGIADDPSLSNFARVIQSVGASDMLRADQQYTVWAPQGLTSAQADSIIAVYEQDKAEGRQLKDNRAMTQFVQNHISLFSHPVSSLTNDTIKMLNSKFMHLVGLSATSGTLKSAPFSDGIATENGMLYKIDAPLPFEPNVREYLEQHSDMDSLVNFIKRFDEYELDEKASVAGPIVDGKTQYLDSVVYLTNRLLDSYGYIQREDSSYLLLAPTNELWAKQLDDYKKYFVYTENIAGRDSLQDIMAKSGIISGNFFNTSLRNSYNRAPMDSLCNTMYSLFQGSLPRTNVYYKPMETIFAGLDRQQCSNGAVYVDPKGAISPYTTFMSRSSLLAYYSSNFIIPTEVKNGVESETQTVMRLEYELYADPTMTSLFRTYPYLDVVSNSSSAQSEMNFRLHGVLSGCYYNIYMVTIPDQETFLPGWYRIGYRVANTNGGFQNPNNPAQEKTLRYYENPNPVSPDIANYADMTGNKAQYFVSSAEKVDTILVQSAVQFPYASYGQEEPTVKLTVSTYGRSNRKGRSYTSRLRLNSFILVPFATEEEAKAAAMNFDAINDDILANKEK